MSNVNANTEKPKRDKYTWLYMSSRYMKGKENSTMGIRLLFYLFQFLLQILKYIKELLFALFIDIIFK